tara:strand:+ start:102 stop:1091 length:990 start_codon:yes stop_codon:yes gene_type:complete
MKIYENRDSNKRITHCPTCGNQGHMWMTCPVPAKMMELKKQGKEPDVSLYSNWYANSYSRRDSNGKLVYEQHIWRKMEGELLRQQRRVEARKSNKAHRERVARSLGIEKKKRKVSCGFCGETGHNRRHCDVMFNFVDDLERASQNYRKQFYERFVKGMGFAEGALLSLSASHWRANGRWHEDWSGIGIVTNISWDQVNMGLTLSSWDYKSILKINVLVDGDTYTIENPFTALVEQDTVDGKQGEIAELFTRNSSWSAKIDSILAPSENIPSEEWFNDGYTECWEWIAKNKSLDDVSSYLSPLIAKWHPSRRGRNAGKLKQRLKDYGWKI